MTIAVGIDVGPSWTRAALWADGSGSVLELGATRSATPSVVFERVDGSTIVGDEAEEADEEGTLTRDPMGVLVETGNGFALQRLITHVLGRAAASVGTAPDVVGMVHRDDWTTEQRQALIEIGTAAGAGVVVPVAQRIANRHRDEEPDELVRALGAAAVAAASLGPIVTREDLGADPPPASGPPAAAPTPPVSVFEESSGTADIASDSATNQPTTALPVIRPEPPPLPVPRARPPWLAIGAVTAVAVAAIVVLFILARDGSDGGTDDTATGTVITTSTATSTTTTSTSSTTSSTTTSSSSSSSSTTTSSTSSTTSSSTSSTTTVPVPVGTPGAVTLVETGLVLDTGAVLRLGDDGDTVLIEIAGSLGEPDSDSGFVESEFCLSARTRFVRWSQLEVVIGEDDEGATSFGQWYVDGADEPPGLVTIDGLGVGATVAFLEVNYGSSLTIVPALEDSEVGLFAATNPGSGGTLVGLTSSLEPEATVLDMWAGDECPRVFT